ncbi:tetratricopeptide repeat protein [Metallosphaera tengchongensis]|uniref:Tetratricopeptide repeat protein n=1 Tax=Metallosphaera tengchongensis TaxID=1532350 RepID=A0A6N0NVM8_9CREN|nr:tetratricopeptide repeat protein [Metallosphaera tengchongensis]QKQ99209.1 tetratricopeptide repeat protein [Metallosphaera tengchongensis]
MDLSELLSSGNLNLALLKLREAIESNPSKENYELLGRILLELGRDDEALDAFLKAEDYITAAKILSLKDPRSALTLLEKVSVNESKLMRAMIFMRMEKYDEALKELGSMDSINENPLFFKVKGIAEFYTDRIYEAMRDLSRGILLYPLDADLYYYRALVRIRLGDEDNAEKDLDIAINLNPYYAEAYLNKGLIAERRGDINKAISMYSKSISIRPNYKEAYIRRSGAYSKIGRDEEAKSDLEKSSQL